MLPGTYYLVRMLDGRIDTQGLVRDLRTHDLLDEITSDEVIEARKQYVAAAINAPYASSETQRRASVETLRPAVETKAVGVPAKDKKPRRLVEDEHREKGSVRWRIYKTYLRASCVSLLFSSSIELTRLYDRCRSYWTWTVLVILIVCNQLLSVSEKFWIKVITT